MARCHAIASPSRSGSDASKVSWLASDAPFNVRMSSALPLTFIYSGSKSCSTSIARRAFGRSRTWPILANTRYLLPSIFSSVLAFAGDSTTTSVLPSYAENFLVFFLVGFFTAVFFFAMVFTIFFLVSDFLTDEVVFFFAVSIVFFVFATNSFSFVINDTSFKHLR